MMAGLFPEQKYTEAAEKALAFIKRQMDVNNFQFQITFAEPYGDEYNGDVVWGEITGLTPDGREIRRTAGKRGAQTARRPYGAVLFGPEQSRSGRSGPAREAYRYFGR